MGGDARIACDPQSGLNQYGSPPWPKPGVPAFGSCTASTISPESFAAAQQLLDRLQRDAQARVETEFDRVRTELGERCGVASLPETGIIFAASGTDLHLIAAQMSGPGGQSSPDTALPLLIVTIEAAETGNGVPAALAARHYSENAAMAGPVRKGEMLEDARSTELVEVPSRDPAGVPVPMDECDTRVEALVNRAVAFGQSVMLVLCDVSKTGFVAPSPACASRLLRRHPGQVDVFVDGCQFRLAPSSIRSYVDHGFLVALTGSKFVTGPPFSGAMLVPPGLSKRWKGRSLPRSLSAYSARADWPFGWAARESLEHAANVGLLLRWEAALSELKAFQALDRRALADFLSTFAARIEERLGEDSAVEPLAIGKPDRGQVSSAGEWDALPTIFPFILRNRVGYLDLEETNSVYKKLLARHGQIGQPVICGLRRGRPLSALRLCTSMRLAVEALSSTGRGPDEVIERALGLLDKVATLF